MVSQSRIALVLRSNGTIPGSTVHAELAPEAAAARSPPDDGASPGQPATVGVEASNSPRGSDRSTDDCSCAICLEHAPLEELAIVKGCDHTYCVKCILRWASHREKATCPQCKQPFEHLFTYRALNGTLNEFPMEESVTLLKRACWFTEYMQVAEQGRSVLSADDSAAEWRDYEPHFHEFDDDDEVEAYYMSSAAGRARVVFGNRRWGNGGFVAGGRQVARPTQPPRTKGKKGKGGSGSSEGGTPAALTSTTGTPPSIGAKGRRGKSSSQGPAGAPASGPGSVSSTTGVRPGWCAAAAAAALGEPAFVASPAAIESGVVKSKTSLLSESLVQARDDAASVSAIPRTPPLSLPIMASVAGRRSGSGISACGSLGHSGRSIGGSPGSGGGISSSLYGSSPGAASSSSSPLGGSPGSSWEGGVPGRRARRAMRRAAEDAALVVGSQPKARTNRAPSTLPVPISWEDAS